MSFNPELAAIRFGYGLSPKIAPPKSIAAMLDALAQPDAQAKRFPVPGYADVNHHVVEMRALNRTRREAIEGGEKVYASAKAAVQRKRRELAGLRLDWFTASVTRCATAEDAFRERLVRFWADHFTVIGKNNQYENLAATFTEGAIRPHVTGRFADMLKATSAHPMMLHFLDQFVSAGENSKIAQKRKRSLNENLGREILELHTLGVGGAYTQDDVRSFANLLAGFRRDDENGFIFDPKWGNPGAETVLGKRYGGEKPKLKDVYRALEDFSVHPDTARHIAAKLATHFVSDQPSEDLVESLRRAYETSKGDLMVVYGALLNHPDAWARELQKVKQPFDFVASSVRALGFPENRLMKVKRKDRNVMLMAPLALMGQTWEKPGGPDGWPEDAGHWSTPQGLAARIQWAMTVPAVLKRKLPDPREFVSTALGELSNDTTRFAATAAETRREGIGMLLSSPNFQRR